MKIMFTNSPLHFSHGHTFTQSDWQTLILPYLAGIVGDKHEINLLDNEHYSFWKSNNALERVKYFKPDVLGVSIIASRDIFSTMSMIEKVKKEYPNLKIIVGGQAGTYYHEELLNLKLADFVVKKEGEETLKELIETIENKSDYSKVKGIYYSLEDKIIETEKRPMIKTLDEAPFPRYDLMPKIKSKWFPNSYTGSIEMSRGCPHNCNFCAVTAYWEGKVRFKSNERILEELRILKKQGRTHVYLADDNFGMNSKKHIALFEKMLQENLDVKFFTQIRTDTVVKNPEMIQLAKKAGLYGVLVGFDSYESKMLNDVTKSTTVELNIQASEILRKNKIAIFGSHIYGLPGQVNPMDFWKTWKLGRKYSDLFRMPHFTPLPFTKGSEEYLNINNRKSSPFKEDEKDFRPRIGDTKQKKKMKMGYTLYNLAHNLSPSEMVGALFHSDQNVRILKRQGYKGVIRHNFYRILRKFELTDI